MFIKNRGSVSVFSIRTHNAIYLECHTGDSGDIGKGRTYADCIGLLTALRGVGTASHLWF